MANNKLSERDICTKHITPALTQSGWDLNTQIREEVTFTKGRIHVRGKTVSRGKGKRADYILYYKNNLPIAVIEAKDDAHGVGDGMQQALEYAEILDIPFVYSSNGNGFLEHDRLKESGDIERGIGVDEFPSPEELYQRYKQQKEMPEEVEKAVLTDYYTGLSASTPRYYQRVAINRAVEAVARGQNRLLLVMATGTGKTFTAFQIIWRLWKAGKKKRILFLVDRTALATQTIQGDFRHFGDKLTKIEKRIADPAYEVYVALYQGIYSSEEERKLFKQFSPDFFDLVVVDECHRGSAKANAAWREVLDYYSSATQIGLTATPKESADVSNRDYFGDPIYTYSLKQGIDDGFLAPYKVIRYILDKDIEWRPTEDTRDKNTGQVIEDRIYNVADYDKNIVIDDRTRLVAETITQYMQDTDPMQKTIVFCERVEHAERLRQALVNANPEEANRNRRYVARITGDNPESKQELENFTNPESPYPVIVTTSKLLTTGVDVQTCKLIVLDSTINSISEFKQIIGRGTRLNEEYGKYYFAIMDFRGATRHFSDPEFDGNPFKEREEIHLSDPESVESMQGELEEETVAPEELKENNPEEEILIDPTHTEESKPLKPVVEGVDFNVATRMVQYIDPESGKLIAESIADYSRKKLQEKFESLDTFLSTWNQSQRKDVIIDELKEKGIPVEELKKDIGLNIDEFDLILHVAFNQKPLTRSERAKKVKQDHILSTYQGQARQILETLLDKYAEEGSLAIDDIGDLEVQPFTQYGTPVEIVNDLFGGKQNYLKALKELQKELYEVTV